MSIRAINDLRDLGDEDVRLLYDIVSAAEASGLPPYRALFAAYDKILAQHGISKENDQLYLRFLLRMGEGRKEGQGLFEQFESLLEKLGFQVAFDADENPVEGENEARSEDSYHQSPPRLDLLQTTSFRPARRVSFDSAYETINESKPLVALPVRPQSVDGHPRAGSGRGIADFQPNDRLPLDRLTYNFVPPQLISQHGHLSSNTNKETYGSDETLADETAELDSNEILDKYIDGPSLSARQTPVDYQAAKSAVSQYQNIKVHTNLMEANARTLRYHQIAAQTVRLFRNWCHWAQQAKHQHQQMNQTAQARDSDVLLRQAFEEWRIHLEQKRQRNENERFFQNLVVQVVRARDMYLLTKAFTHWAQSTAEEVSRRTEARSKMLQTRYFQAWREITAVNAMKVRRQVLSKFLSVWTARSDRFHASQDQAVWFRTNKLISQQYRKWFWQFCEQRTPEWYATNRNKKLFRHWVDATQQAQVRESLASEFRSIELLSRCFSSWMRRSTTIQEHERQASSFRRGMLLATSVQELQRRTYFDPLQRETANAVDNRILRSAIYKWSTKTIMSIEATKVNQSRTMRNAWNAWNDKLRCQTLTNQINDRLTIQALYKWVLAERLTVCSRTHAEGLISVSFRRWKDRSNAASVSLGHANHLFKQAKDRKSLSSTLLLWSQKAQAKREEAAQATRFRNHVLTSRSMSTWNASRENLTQLYKWSEDARFYFLSSQSVKRWHSTTIATKKSRRRAAFATFRQQTKIAKAKIFLSKWRLAAQQNTDMTRQAEEIAQGKLEEKGIQALSNWRQWSLTIQNQHDQANAFWEEHLLIQCMQLMVGHFQHTKDLEVRAVQLAFEHTENTALACLRKLNWNAFQLKRHHESADSLLQRTQRKHFREMLRFWANTAKDRKQLRRTGQESQTVQDDSQTYTANSSLSPSQLSSNRRTPFNTSAPPNVASRVSELSQARIGTKPFLSAQSPNPLTPGYLRTPSRRSLSSRLDGRVTASSTITPFMSRLHTQYPSIDPLSSHSTVSTSVLRDGKFGLGFAEIPKSESTE